MAEELVEADGGETSMKEGQPNMPSVPRRPDEGRNENWSLEVAPGRWGEWKLRLLFRMACLFSQ